MMTATIHSAATESKAQELAAIRNSAAVYPLLDRAFLRVTGSDATRWLNGMVTNSIQALQPGEGNYNFLLNAQGRIQGDCTIFREPDGEPSTLAQSQPAFVLATIRQQLETIYQHLDKFIIMDDVELTRMEHLQKTLLLLGGKAPDILRSIEHPLLSNSQSFADSAPLRLHYYQPSAVQLITPGEGSISCFEISGGSPLIDSLLEEAKAAGAAEVSPEALEALRILSGVPVYGVDIRDKDLPQETNQARALHFNKGCYLGQEIVERIRSRGQVHRLFTQFKLTGPIPELPASLEANGKTAGELTSAVQIGDQAVALGYARREALDLHQPLTYPGGTAEPTSASNLMAELES